MQHLKTDFSQTNGWGWFVFIDEPNRLPQFKKNRYPLHTSRHVFIPNTIKEFEKVDTTIRTTTIPTIPRTTPTIPRTTPTIPTNMIKRVPSLHDTSAFRVDMNFDQYQEFPEYNKDIFEYISNELCIGFVSLFTLLFLISVY
jgi:hypothetical protein